jgi:hypothetical protein
MDSLRYHQEMMGGTLNHLGVPWSHPSRWLERVGEEEKRSPRWLQASQRVLYPGDQTCSVKGPDLFGGTLDQTV